METRMKASFVDLRKKSAEMIRALQRNESVTILYRGSPCAIMQPLAGNAKSAPSAKQHAAFGLWKDHAELNPVARHVRNLRKGRFDAL